ncbi:RTA1 like protein-domain-containing protein [Xylariales sp. PMI_506]|nr:RTA1 like protein-domain-containing protein [Xylariales sp. PMI_506]
MEDGKYVAGSIWFYSPNRVAPVFFALAFLTSGSVHLWQTLHYKCWRLTGIYVFCATLFTAGFIIREIGTFDEGNLVKYIISICLVYAAPPLYELGNYYVLGRILYFVPYHSPLHPGRVLTTFSAISMIVEALNAHGAAFAVNQSLSQSQRDTGKALLKAALLMQIIVVCLFVALALYFQVKCKRNGINSAKVHTPLMTLYISTAIIATRTIYRVVEYFDLTNVNFSQPNFDPSSLSPIVRYEWFFYVFEATIMLINSVLLNVRHPRRWLPPSTKIYLAKDGVTEVTGPGYKQDRNFFATLFDPFDVYGMIRGTDKTNRFWDNESPGNAEISSKTASSHRGRTLSV